jgi:hypothetical protein
MVIHILTIMIKKKKEYELISNLIPSASLLSAYILWGPYKSIEENIKYLNHLWKQKYS